jgi:hypothetical protein
MLTIGKYLENGRFLFCECKGTAFFANDQIKDAFLTFIPP